MGVDANSIMELSIVQKTIALAIEAGREWGEKYTNSPKWAGDKDKMAHDAINEATLWSISSGAVTGLGGGFVALVGIPADISFSLYWKVKLAAALFQIYEIDTTDSSSHMLIVAAAAGVTVSELADQIGTKAAMGAIRSALMSLPGSVFREINKALAIKLISKAGEKTLLNVAKVMPIVGGFVGGTVNGISMSACGHGILFFIKTLS